MYLLSRCTALCSTSLFLSNVYSLTMSTSTRPKNIVVIGGGIQGTSVAYFLAQSDIDSITLLESQHVASAASGKGGGFMARSWGDNSPTQPLHHLAFDLYAELAPKLGCKSYRKLPVLSVNPQHGKTNAKQDFVPSWLDTANVGRISTLGYGDDTAQITPKEFVHAMLEDAGEKINVVIGTCTSVDYDSDNVVTGVRYTTGDNNNEEVSISADTVVVSAGPWSCIAEDWFPGSVKLPMEGVKSASIVWHKPGDSSSSSSSADTVDGTALFCGEDDRFGTHLEVYPRPDGTIYICGIGGSDYISTEELKQGAFRSECLPSPQRIDAASKSFRNMSPLYENAEMTTQACMRPCPPDALPYMGRIPGYTGAYINAGHNCWGIAWAPACGKCMAELILNNGECKSVNLRPFDPARFTQAAKGGRGRKKGSTSVGEQW